jgi:hypothetical protein
MLLHFETEEIDSGWKGMPFDITEGKFKRIHSGFGREFKLLYSFTGVVVKPGFHGLCLFGLQF